MVGQINAMKGAVSKDTAISWQIEGSEVQFD